MTSSRRILDPSDLSKLNSDVDVAAIRAWRNRWVDWCRLNGLPGDYRLEEKTAALRMALYQTMQQVVEVVLGIQPADIMTPDDILNRVAEHVRAKGNIALERMASKECPQGANESFDEFYVQLRRLADSA